MRNLALQNAIDAYPDGIVISARFQRFIKFQDAVYGIPKLYETLEASG